MEGDCITLEGMVFFGYHGVRADEQSLGQQFVVDLALYCDLGPASRADDLAQTVNYSEVHRQVRDIVQGDKVQLIESLAGRIAGVLLAAHPRLDAVRVKVSKPQVRLGETVLAGAAVQILRRRG
jgi:7,8-dihydroneopterin aldolase/epimerase/oxygenase